MYQRAKATRVSNRHAEQHQHTRPHWCGGRRRDRRARAGFEIDHSEPQARVWRSRGRPGPTAPGTPVGPQANKQEDHQSGGTGGPGCGGRGRRQGLAGLRDDAPNLSAHQAPQVWRAPEGPEGTGGLRGAAPNKVRTPSLAGGRALRRPEHPWGHKQHGPAGGQATRRPEIRRGYKQRDNRPKA